MARCAHRYFNKNQCRHDAIEGGDYCEKHDHERVLAATHRPEVTCPTCGGKAEGVHKNGADFIDCKVPDSRCGRQNVAPGTVLPY